MGCRNNGQNRLRKLPVAVETVHEWGYPLDRIEAMYARMTSGRFETSSSDVGSIKRTGEVPSPSGASNYAVKSEDVTAAALFAAMESEYGPPRSGSTGFTSETARHGTGAHDSETEMSAEDDGATDTQPSQCQPTEHENLTSDHSATMSDATANPPPTSSVGGSEAKARSASSAITASQQESDTDKENTPPSASESMSNSVQQPGSESHSDPADDETRQRSLELTKRVRMLREENRKLKERQICRHCLERPVSLTLLPCGHFCFCQECGSTFHSCPICRKTILADVRTIVS